MSREGRMSRARVPRHLGANRDPRKREKSLNLCSLVLGPLLIWVRSWDSCKSLPKAQALSRISLISLSIAEAIRLKAMGEMRAGIKTVIESAFHCYTNPQVISTNNFSNSILHSNITKYTGDKTPWVTTGRKDRWDTQTYRAPDPGITRQDCK